MIFIKRGSTPTLLINKSVDVKAYTNVVFTLQDSQNNIITISNPTVKDNAYQLNLSQADTLMLNVGNAKLEAQYIFEDKTAITFTYTDIRVLESIAFESVTGEGNSEIVNANTPLNLELIGTTTVVASGTGGAVATVNEKSPDEFGNVQLVANDINFTDGENFQQKYDKGELKGQKGDTGAQGVKGDKGDTGADGKQGIQGLKGDKGDTGEQGQKGDKGDTGENGTNGTNGKDGLTTSITVNGKTKTQVNGVITLDDYDTATQQIELTASQVASGVDLVNNAEYVVVGEVSEFVINSVDLQGSGMVQFVASDAVNITLPSGTGFANEPTFEQGKIYNLIYLKGSFVADGGR